MAAPGVYAGITASAGDGITVNATATSKVVLRNLFVNGLGLGSAGVAVTGLAAETHIEQLVIDGFVNYGIIAFSDVRISDTTIRNSGSGIWIDNAGAAVQGTIERVLVKDMAGGDPGAPGSGIVVLRNANVTVRNSVATVTTRGILASDNGVLNIENCVATNSNEGISSFGDAIVRISNNVVTNNTVGIISLSQTTIQTWQNNKVAGNGTNIVGGPLTNLAQN